MERVAKLKKMSDTRGLLRLCFTRLPSASQVPLEVWRDNVVLETDLPTMTLLAQTCKAFWELVEEIRRCNVRVALVYRQYDQIPLAHRCLKMCAHNGVAEAMFHLGYAKIYGGFGEEGGVYKTKWMKRAAEAGCYIAMAIYASLIRLSDPIESEVWIERVLSSNDNLAIGYYYYLRNFVQKSFPFLLESAKEGNEFAQYWMSEVCRLTLQTQPQVRIWLERAAKQGLYVAQRRMEMFDRSWAKRADKQSILF